MKDSDRFNFVLATINAIVLACAGDYVAYLFTHSRIAEAIAGASIAISVAIVITRVRFTRFPIANTAEATKLGRGLAIQAIFAIVVLVEQVALAHGIANPLRECLISGDFGVVPFMLTTAALTYIRLRDEEPRLRGTGAD